MRQIVLFASKSTSLVIRTAAMTAGTSERTHDNPMGGNDRWIFATTSAPSAERWWLVVGSVVLALAAATLVTALTPPRYAASVTFFVSAQTKGGVTDAYQGDLFSQQRVASYVDLLTSDRLADMIVASRPRPGLTASQVQSRISAQALPDTVLLDGDRDRRQPRPAHCPWPRTSPASSCPARPDPRNAVRRRPRAVGTGRGVAGPRLGRRRSPRPRPATSAWRSCSASSSASARPRCARRWTPPSRTPTSLAEHVDTPVLATVPFDTRAKQVTADPRRTPPARPAPRRCGNCGRTCSSSTSTGRYGRSW